MIRLAIRVPRENADTVLAELLTLAPGGLEEREQGAHVEFAIYGAPGELPDLGAIRATAGETVVEVSSADLPDADWAEAWKAFHRPVDARGRFGAIRVRPPWAPPPASHAVDVVIEPGQAFGTGAHDTTRLCLELLLDSRPDGALADWGTGSGVLAIAAAKLGYAPVSGCDHDPRALEAARAAAEANGVALRLERADLRRAPGPHAPTVCANLVRPVLLDVAAQMRRAPDRLIASGLQGDEADEVAAAFARHGLREAARRSAGDWSALLLTG